MSETHSSRLPALLQDPRPAAAPFGARTLPLEPATLQGEVALLTDGLSDSGRATALALAVLGLDVALVHPAGQAEEARALGQELVAAGRRVLLLSLRSPPAEGAGGEVVERAEERTRELLGRLDLVVDTARWGSSRGGGWRGADAGGGSVPTARVDIVGL